MAMNGKHFVVATLFTLVLLTLVFIPVAHQQSGGTYDPWIDTNDDGIIDSYDLQTIASIYGTSGAPINKTALLLDLQNRVNSLNASLDELRVRVNSLESRVNALETPYPFWSVYDNNEVSTNSPAFVDIPYMAINLTLKKSSRLIFIYTVKAWVSSSSGYAESIIKWEGSGTFAFSREQIAAYVSYQKWSNHVFLYWNAFAAGTYAFKLQWGVVYATAYMDSRYFCIMALPG